MTGAEPTSPITTPPPLRPRRRWLRLAPVVSVVLIAAWFATGGYDRLTVPNPHWKLPNGDTIEVLAYDQYYEAMYDIFGHRLQGANSLRLWFRSDFRDAARDHSDVVAASQVICPL